MAVPALSDAVLVNTGDFMQDWSSGHYPSTIHRVRQPGLSSIRHSSLVWRQTPPVHHSLLNPCAVHADGAFTRARYSVVFFCSPDCDALIRPLRRTDAKPGSKLVEPFRAGDRMPA